MKKYFLPLAVLFALVSVFTVGTVSAKSGGNGQLTTVSVTFYSDQGLMADGQPTHIGACAALISQFKFGTEIQLFDPKDLNHAKFSCTVEDTGSHICQNDIDVALPGQAREAINLGIESLGLKVVGFDQKVADEAAKNHVTNLGCQGGKTH